MIKVAGVSYRLDALQDDAFAPGKRLALVPEPDNEHDPNAIGIWDAERRVQAGYVPAEIARELDASEWQAVSLWEFVEDGSAAACACCSHRMTRGSECRARDPRASARATDAARSLLA